MVWAASRSLGVGRAIRLAKNTDPGSRPYSSKTVVVCFYFPPGNVASYFNDNVHSPLAEQAGASSSSNANAAGPRPPPKVTNKG